MRYAYSLNDSNHEVRICSNPHSQSVSLFVHNKITVPQYIRRNGTLSDIIKSASSYPLLIVFYNWNRWLMWFGYISWEMTPTSIGGEKQAGISGGSQSPSWYSLRQDCRGAQEKYVMQLHDAHLAARMPRHSWIIFGFLQIIILHKFIDK